jgi:hypothetical protein
LTVSPLNFPGSYSAEELLNANVCDSRNPLYGQCLLEVEKIKKKHAEMLHDQNNIESSGRSVPEIFWNVGFVDFKTGDNFISG